MVKVKFCGLKRPCDIVWANELRPDYAGFVFAGKKRRVSDDQAVALRKALDPSIPAVGVFVDDSLEHIGAAGDGWDHPDRPAPRLAKTTR